jgi:hypothetical protein
MIFKEEVSIFSNVKSRIPESSKNYRSVIEDIGNGRYEKQVNKARSYEGDNYKNYKQNLPAVTWAGEFSQRNKDNILNFSSFIYCDIDKCNPDRKQEVFEKEYVHAVWTSLSGKGLGFLCYADIEKKEDYARCFDTICDDIKGLDKVSDYTRLNILSADKDILVRQFPRSCKPKTVNKIYTYKEFLQDSQEKDVKICKIAFRRASNKGHRFVPQNDLHNSLVCYFGVTNRLGATKEAAMSYLIQSVCFNHEYFKVAADDIYKRYANQFGMTAL